MSEVAIEEKSQKIAKLVYILYLVGLLLGVTAIIGLIVAYIYKGDAPEWLKTHYRFQIRTFWIGFLYIALGVVLAFVLIGYLLLLFWLVWVIVRCIKGLKLLSEQEAHPNPTGWFF